MDDRKTLVTFNEFRVLFKKSVKEAKVVMKILCLHDNQEKKDYIRMMKYLDDVSMFLESIKGDPKAIRDFINTKKFKKVKKLIKKELEDTSMIVEDDEHYDE